MWRMTIREMFLVTLIVGIGLAWGMEHKVHLTVREDATHLARFGDPFRGACGNASATWHSVANRYWERSADDEEFVIVKEADGTIRLDFEPRIVIQEEDEAKLGIEIEP